MTVLLVLKAGETTFDREERIESAAGAPLTPEGMAQVRELADTLAGENVRAIVTGAGEAETQTGKLLGKILGVKPRTESDLREIHYGLWQGLTIEEIKRRHPKVFRTWQESPPSVQPPGGETIEEVCQRLREALHNIIRRHRDDVVPLVLRPVALGLCRCILEDTDIAALWQQAHEAGPISRYEVNARTL